MRRKIISYEGALKLLREGKRAYLLGMGSQGYRIDGAIMGDKLSIIRSDTWKRLRKVMEKAGRDRGNYIYKIRR